MPSCAAWRRAGREPVGSRVLLGLAPPRVVLSSPAGSAERGARVQVLRAALEVAPCVPGAL